MSSETAYSMLMTSLPHLGSLFGAKYSVISRIKLDRRLKMLTPEDAQTLSTIESVTCWEHLRDVDSDRAFVQRARKALQTVTHPELSEIIRDRIEIRTLVAALRRRHQGLPPPAESETWGAGRWVNVIRRNWNEPGFGVQNAFPWVLEAHRMLEENNTVGLERLLLEEAWKALGRKAKGHTFDFVAVVVYVLRWDVMERWTHYQKTIAEERFAALIDAAILGHMPSEGPRGEAAHG